MGVHARDVVCRPRYAQDPHDSSVFRLFELKPSAEPADTRAACATLIILIASSFRSLE